jgi:hypothetical protein
MPAPGDDGGQALAVDGLRSTWADGVLRLVLDRPAARNALSIAVRRGLIRALRAADADASTRAVLITGTDPAFSAGVDLTESLGADGRAPAGARTDPAAVIRATRTGSARRRRGARAGARTRPGGASRAARAHRSSGGRPPLHRSHTPAEKKSTDSGRSCLDLLPSRQSAPLTLHRSDS